ncbi:antitoxin VapB family protein [Halostagnicola sp. A-GB9-2]|nr:antitoxin VapB family protein [Halostagnicola sp. A-GB9-2]MDJ1434243.1 antitoxin VapB family protein [Halostagnicola sp. A-GB9-2]
MADDITTVQISTETWRELNGRKNPGETFDDVIQRLLEEGGE